MLTPLEAREAAALGWQLCEVYDLEIARPRLMVLPLDFVRPGVNSQTAQDAVIRMAKSGNQLAIRTLTLIAQYNMKKGKK